MQFIQTQEELLGTIAVVMAVMDDILDDNIALIRRARRDTRTIPLPLPIVAAAARRSRLVETGKVVALIGSCIADAALISLMGVYRANEERFSLLAVVLININVTIAVRCKQSRFPS